MQEKNYFWILLEKGGIAILQFCTLIILGRLLTPSDYGVYGTMIIFISIAETLIEAGLGGALIQKKIVTQQDINTLFFFNLSLSIVFYIILFICAPLLSTFYHIENLTTYFRVIGITLIFYALSIIQISLLNRNLKFRQSSIINLSANILSAIIAIIMAYYGLGIWALVTQVISTSILLSVFYWLTNKTTITFSLSKESFVYMWSFGIHTVGATVLQTIVNNITTSIIPKISTVTQAGHYFQATRVNNVPVGILTQCIDKGVFPTLSREENNMAIVQKAREINRFVLSVIMPIFPLISLCAVPVVVLLLGSQWIESATFLEVLAWSGIALVIQAVSRNIIKATGMTKYILYIEIAKSIFTLFVLFISVQLGVRWMVICFVLSTYIGAVLWMWVLSNKMHYSIREQTIDMIPSFMLAIISYLIIHISGYYWDLVSNNIWILPIGYLLYWSLGIIIQNKEICTMTQKIISILKTKTNDD